MRKLLIVATVATLTAASARAAIITEFVLAGSPTIDGTRYHIWEMRVTTDADWTNSRLNVSLTLGEMYHHPLGQNFEPSPARIALYPDLEWDTYVTVPGGWPGQPSFAGPVTMDPMELHVSWFDAADTGAGVWKVAQIVMTGNASGTLSGASYDRETSAAFDYTIPEPTAIALLAGGGLLALARRRRLGPGRLSRAQQRLGSPMKRGESRPQE